MRLAHYSAPPTAAGGPRGALAVALLGLGLMGALVAGLASMTEGVWAAAFVVAAVFGGLLLFAPWLGVLFILATTMFKYPDFVYRLPLSPNRAVSAVLLVMLFAAFLGRRRLEFFRTPTYVGFAIVVVALLVNVAFFGSTDGPGKLSEVDVTDRTVTRTLGQFLILTFFGAFMRTRRHLALTVALFLVALFVTIPGALTHTYDIAGAAQSSMEKARALASSGIQSAENANRLAFVAALGIVFVWFAMQHYRSPVLRLAAWVSFPALVLTILLSGSRSGVINLGVLIILLALQGGARPTRVAAAALLLCIALASASLVVPQAIIDRLTTLFPSEEVVTSATRSVELRGLMYHLGFKLFSAAPLTGVGVGNVRWMTALDPEAQGYALTMHNHYLLVLVEGGIGYLAAYLTMFWLTWRSLRHSGQLALEHPEVGLRWLVLATRTGLVLLLVFSAFAEAWNEFPFVILLGLSISLAVLYRQATLPRPVPTRWMPSPSST